jgi:hypothetical protein
MGAILRCAALPRNEPSSPRHHQSPHDRQKSTQQPVVRSECANAPDGLAGHGASTGFSQRWLFPQNCQDPVEKSKVITQHSTSLPPLYSRRYLADFIAGLGILIIGGKKENSPGDPKPKEAAQCGLFLFRRQGMGKLCGLRWAPWAPHPLGDPSPKGPCKSPIFSRLPQSKTACRQPLSPQRLATAPPRGGGGVFGGVNLDWLRATGYSLAATGERLPKGGIASAIRWT